MCYEGTAVVAVSEGKDSCMAVLGSIKWWYGSMTTPWTPVLASSHFLNLYFLGVSSYFCDLSIKVEPHHHVWSVLIGNRTGEFHQGGIAQLLQNLGSITAKYEQPVKSPKYNNSKYIISNPCVPKLLGRVRRFPIRTEW